MKTADLDLLRRIEKLIRTVQNLCTNAPDADARHNFDYTLLALTALAGSVIEDQPIFGIEPWHALHDDVPLDAPGEMLLRLKDSRGEPLPPYPAIMTFYKNNMTAEIDTILFLCALREFKRGPERQVSINVSARSLKDGEFVKASIARLEALDLEPGRKVIIEIHESTPNLIMNQKVLELFRKTGVLFAIDDVGLSMNDVFRLAEFDGIADFIKLDRQSVNSKPQNPNSLDHVVSFIHSMLPSTVMIAEGVKSAAHALDVHRYHPDIKYVQGLYLPGREEFAADWQALERETEKTATP